MPNVAGLAPATSFTRAGTFAYGPRCKVVSNGADVTLYGPTNDAVASVTNGKPKAALARIDGDTVAAVNAFLRPYGKVKTYWRTGEYRWHPLTGTPTVPAKRTSAPKPAPVAPVAAPVSAPEAPVVPVSVPKGDANGGTKGIETARTWRDRYAKRPVARAITKSYSTVGAVLAPSSDLRVLDAMKALRDAGRPAFGLITGPAGTAKTRLAVEWAFVNDLPVVVIDGMSIQTATDWFGGTVQTADGRWVWEWSDAAKMILSGEPCLIVVDELNRPENERALNGIMPLTDWKATVKPLGAPHALTLKPGQCIIATLNEGIEYVGTVEVDAAVRDRFTWGVRMTYTNETIETRVLLNEVPGLDREVAKRLVRVAAGQRAKVDDDTLFPSHNTISTRVLVEVAAATVMAGLTPKEALWGAMRSKFTPEDEVALTNLIEAQFGPDAAPVGDDLADDDEIENMLAASD
jgi:MoxR-like ATPase